MKNFVVLSVLFVLLLAVQVSIIATISALAWNYLIAYLIPTVGKIGVAQAYLLALGIDGARVIVKTCKKKIKKEE